MSEFSIAALYKFVSLPDYVQLREPIYRFCVDHGIKGAILLAEEGINGTVAGSFQAIDELVGYLERDRLFRGRFEGSELKFSGAREMPFSRMKVKLKREIVTLRAPEADPTTCAGVHIEPESWNDIISDKDTIVIDTRNDYEVAIGTFRGAVNPGTPNFTAFKDFVEQNLDPEKNRKVAMFCTGGIRCEKASAYMRARGFDEVFHLRGGILRYLEEIPREKSMWEGECFVFDERVSVGHGLAEGDLRLCRACRFPLSPADMAHERFIEGRQCHRCADVISDKSRARAAERERQIRLAAARGQEHIGDNAARHAEANRQRVREVRRQQRALNGPANSASDV